MKEVDLKNASVSILVEVDGVVHLVTMERDKYETLTHLIKRSIRGVAKTKRTQNELYDFLEVVK